MKKTITFLCCCLIWCGIIAQNHHSRFESIDVQHYTFEIHLNDTTDKIEAKANVLIQFSKPANNLVLDLVSLDKEQKGMFVNSVHLNNEKLEFKHNNNQLEIELNKTTKAKEILDLEVQYSGVPVDGLVISENKYGERTFFGDNWPDRAKHWLPTVDHPSDKATLEFLVYAPEHYKVISNGYLVEKKQLENGVEFTHWKEDVPLSAKLMVIGVADFAVGNHMKYKSTPVSSWVFEKNKKQGFENYKYGTEALEFFSELIGTYSYEKLAHVQSKTRYGGMENASCIFYHERTAINDQSQEGLFAHEVAHQWFGNSVTEQNWHHVWLSEGFATYLTHIYKQHFNGDETFRNGLKNDRERVIKYAQRNLSPIIDTTVTEYIRLLNANSYQKASWVLHMLRIKLDDDVFFSGLRKYYAEFQNSTALTNDFREVMETVSGKDLETFFTQWLWKPGHPVLEIDINEKSIIIVQKQNDYLFTFPIELELVFADGLKELRRFEINARENHFPLNSESECKDYKVDPNVKLLFEIR